MIKKRVEQAIHNYVKKNTPSDRPKRINKKPEKEVERQVLAWCKDKGWLMNVVESKAVFSKAAGRYLSGQVQAGFSDLVGLTDQGLAVAIELKAPGRLKTLRLAQFEHLEKVIARHGFGCVVDSVELLETVYQRFCELSNDARRDYLLSLLPTPREKKETVLFD